MVIGLTGRLCDDPHEVARTRQPILTAIEEGHPACIVAHIGRAGREVGKLMREIPAWPAYRARTGFHFHGTGVFA